MNKTMTCIICPLGCSLDVTFENGCVTNVEGNSCPRGKKYAETELTDPRRSVTSIMRCENGEMLSVKTDIPVKKSDVFSVMETINNFIVPLPVKIGDVIIKDVCGSNIIATKNITG